MTRGCRFCQNPMDADHGVELVLDLGATPLANDLKDTREEAFHAERYPLTLLKCGDCRAFQLSYAVDKELLFRNYHYATPDMHSLTKHYGRVHRFLKLEPDRHRSLLEIGGNNGAFLRTFYGPRQPFLKINVEPATNIESNVGDAQHYRTIREFFNHALALDLRTQHGAMDLVIARHCFAHIDDLDEVVKGVSDILEPGSGIFYIENAYVFSTIFGGQLDQVYHEHMSYLSLGPVQRLLGRYGMRVFDVSFSDVHGGSIMVKACKNDAHYDDDRVPLWLLAEQQHLFHEVDYEFNKRAQRAINELADMFFDLAKGGKTVDLYGATAKSTTLLNAVADQAPRINIRRCYDRAPLKIGKFLPGTAVPIVAEEAMHYVPPDFCLITAWNYADEIMRREKWYTEQGGKWILPFPELRIV